MDLYRRELQCQQAGPIPAERVFMTASSCISKTSLDIWPQVKLMVKLMYPQVWNSFYRFFLWGQETSGIQTTLFFLSMTNKTVDLGLFNFGQSPHYQLATGRCTRLPCERRRKTSRSRKRSKRRTTSRWIDRLIFEVIWSFGRWVVCVRWGQQWWTIQAELIHSEQTQSCWGSKWFTIQEWVCWGDTPICRNVCRLGHICHRYFFFLIDRGI